MLKIGIIGSTSDLNLKAGSKVRDSKPDCEQRGTEDCLLNKCWVDCMRPSCETGNMPAVSKRSTEMLIPCEFLPRSFLLRDYESK